MRHLPHPDWERARTWRSVCGLPMSRRVDQDRRAEGPEECGCRSCLQIAGYLPDPRRRRRPKLQLLRGGA